MDYLDSLFNNAVNSEGYEDSEEVKKAYGILITMLESIRPELPPNCRSLIDDHAVDYSIAKERQGFKYGFILATRMMTECFAGKFTI